MRDVLEDPRKGDVMVLPSGEVNFVLQRRPDEVDVADNFDRRGSWMLYQWKAFMARGRSIVALTAEVEDLRKRRAFLDAVRAERNVLRDELLCIRAALRVPEGTEVSDHVAKVAHALADMLHPLAPWPPGWAPVPAEGIVVLDLRQDEMDASCRAYVSRDDRQTSNATWTIPAAGDGGGDDEEGHARDVLTAIADCMARLEVANGKA